MEQRERSADTVYCQPLSALGSRRELHSRSSTGHLQCGLTLLCVFASLHDYLIRVCLHLGLCRLARANQTYLFPVHLTDQLLPSAIFYATVGPLLVYMAVHRLIVIPYTQAQKEQWVNVLCLKQHLTLSQQKKLLVPGLFSKTRK